ncbi:uncharacterized protein UTRI_01634_B [Ustilago trichophora]|uniref:SUN domain-containing protein n=1 Tax=Ustilago trichophora TaxID=86804 RepID=A0A5C3E2N5_9BASI|nr:uncharacterized protein UTRI_01634_B [Ustilago trichophora]
MSSRNGARGAPRRSPRISARSETPDTHNATIASTPTRRALSPPTVEHMTSPAQSTRTNPSLASLRAFAGGSASVGIKQEDISTSFFVRAPSDQSRLTSPPTYQPTLLRGDQRGFNDSRDATSLSIFSSEDDVTDSYQQEEREVAQLQDSDQQQQQPAPRINGARKISGQRKARPSLDDRPYRPGSEEEEDDDDIRSPTRSRRKKGRISDSLGAYEQGRIANATWMSGNAKRRARKSGGGARDSHDANDGGDSVMDPGEDDDAGAASGKETRFDGASDSGNDDEDENENGDDDHTPLTFADKDELPLARQPRGRSVVVRLLSALLSFIFSIIFMTIAFLIKVPKRAWNALGRDVSKALLQGLTFAIAVLAAAYLFQNFGDLNGLSARLPSLTPAYDDVPGSSPGHSRSATLALDRENQRLRAELTRLTARIDTLSSSIESQISSSLSSAAAKIQADADTRQSTELNRLTASTKRTISRLAQDELKSIQDSVSSSVELMLRDLDKKVNTQLKQRADDTEGRFFIKLEEEVGRIAKYANDEVNARLGQAFDQTFLSELIEERLETYSRDRTGKIDWAAVTSGAWIAEEGTVHKGYRYNSVWNVGKFLAQGRKVAIGEPVKAITPGAGLGGDNCWMTGWNSMLQVNLAEPKVVDDVVVEHPLPGMIRTAPRRILVWGIVDPSDRQYYQQYRRTKASTQSEYFEQLLPEPFHAAIPQEYQKEAPLLLGFFEFKSTGSTLQTFNLTEEARAYPFGVEAVRWQFVDGWAKTPPICVHRVRVHGSAWPVFADKLVD